MPDDEKRSDGKDAEDLDRELIEFLNELRVMLPGVQVLFAFLLAVPFTQRFDRVTELQQGAFFVALLATTLGTVLLIAPSAYHRIRWRQYDKEQLLRTSNRLAIAGTVLLAVAMTAAVFMVTDLVFQFPTTITFTLVCALGFAWFWYGLPLWRKVQD